MINEYIYMSHHYYQKKDEILANARGQVIKSAPYVIFLLMGY